MTSRHQPVLLHELVEALNIKPASVVLDATVGGGGHAAAIAERLSEKGALIGLDLDRGSLERARVRLKGVRPAVHLLERNFRDLDGALRELGIQRVDAIAMDLGLNSDQLEPPEGNAGRGFSFRRDEPLRMTFKAHLTEEDTTAREIVNEWEEEHIADILHGFGEERFSRRIAAAIAVRRNERPIETTSELVCIIEHAVPRWYKFRRLHPATKTFQALRMAVNDELGALREALEKGMDVLTPHGRCAVITFHSVEDRMVKTFFNDRMRKGNGTVVAKKPIVPTKAETGNNPRARSAKLRAFERH